MLQQAPILLRVKVLRHPVFALEHHHVATEFLWLTARRFRCEFGEIGTRLLRRPFGFIQPRCTSRGRQINEGVRPLRSNNVRRDMRIGGLLKLLVAHLCLQRYPPFIHQQPLWHRGDNRTRRFGHQPAQQLLPEKIVR